MTREPTHPSATSQVITLRSRSNEVDLWSALPSDLEHRHDVLMLDVPVCTNAFAIGAAASQTSRQIERLGGPVHLVAHADEAAVAIRVALSRPDLVRSLTLYDPIGCDRHAISDRKLAGLSILILMGMESPNDVQHESSAIHAAMPCAELAILPGLGHMGPIETPEWVNPRIVQHIARVERAAARVIWPERMAA